MEERQQPQKIPVFRLIIEMLVVIISFFIFGFIFTWLLFFVQNGPTLEAAGELAQVAEIRSTSAFFAGPIGLFVTLVVGDSLLRRRQVSLRKLGLKSPDGFWVTIAKGLGLTFVLLLFWAAVLTFYQANDYTLHLNLFTIVGDHDFYFYFAMVAAAWIASGFGEEVLFRGFFMNNFSEFFRNKKTGAIVACILQAILFSLFYPPDTRLNFIESLFHFVPILMTGLAFGWAYFLFNRNLWPLIIAHGLLYNIYFLLIYNDVLG